MSAQLPQVANDGSAYVNPANTFTDTATGQTFGYQSALSGIIARAGSGRTVSYAPGTVGLAEQPLLTATGATSGPGALVTPDGSQAGFEAIYYGGDDPTDASNPRSRSGSSAGSAAATAPWPSGSPTPTGARAAAPT